MDAAGGNWVRVGAAGDLSDGQMKAVRLGDRDIALYRVDGTYFATDNVCTHEYARLTDGWLEEGEIECPLHAGKFDVRTGKGLCAPIDKDLETFPVRVEGADLLLRLPS
jgi:nitrite reductase/ring-hydroxylating ferredoxin subunit